MYIVFHYDAGVIFKAYKTAAAAKRVATQYNKNAGFIRTSVCCERGATRDWGCCDGKYGYAPYASAHESDYEKFHKGPKR